MIFIFTILPVLLAIHVERIVGGNPNAIMSHPYLTGIFYKGTYKCAGAILSANYVLSAAHCDYRKSGDNVNTIKVRGGMQNTGQMTNVQEKTASAIKKNPSYSSASMKNDIMLIKLSSSFTWNSYVKSIGLPTSSGTTTAYTICSWGYGISMRDTKDLICYNGKNVDTSTCNAKSGWDGKVYTPQQMCIGGSVSTDSVCYHDGGAAAVNANTIYALYSFPDLQSNGKTYPTTAGCNQANKPAVFTQVNQYISWINSNMT